MIDTPYANRQAHFFPTCMYTIYMVIHTYMTERVHAPVISGVPEANKWLAWGINGIDTCNYQRKCWVASYCGIKIFSSLIECVNTCPCLQIPYLIQHENQKYEFSHHSSRSIGIQYKRTQQYLRLDDHLCRQPHGSDQPQ